MILPNIEMVLDFLNSRIESFTDEELDAVTVTLEIIGKHNPAFAITMENMVKEQAKRMHETIDHPPSLIRKLAKAQNLIGTDFAEAKAENVDGVFKHGYSGVRISFIISHDALGKTGVSLDDLIK